MAEFPELVEKCFKPPSDELVQKYNDIGVYEVVCYKNGVPTSVVVDDYFPCDPVSGTPCYSHAAGNELWVLLLEKAWAKLHGSYERIEGGLPHRALMDFTGDTGKFLDVAKEKDLWQKLLSFDEHGFLMCACSPGHDNLTKSNKKPSAGIVPGHAYTLKAVKEHNGGACLVNLRNPWGSFEWDGDWSDKSPLWTQTMKDYFKPKLQDDDGSFWMSEADFRRHFDGVSVLFKCSRCGDPWSTARQQFTLTGEDVNTHCFKFAVEANASGFFTLLQIDNRIRGTPDYIQLSFAVYGPLNTPGEHIREVARSNCWASREVTAEVRAEKPMVAGKYVVVLYNPSRTKDRTVTLELHLDQGSGGPKPILTKQKKGGPQGTTGGLSILKDDLRSQLVLASSISGEASQDATIGPFQTKANWLPNGGYSIAAKNTNPHSNTVTWDFSKCSGLRTQGTGTGKVETQLPPASQQRDFHLVTELMPVIGATSRKCGYSISYH
jgi:hypothetical protein